MEVVLSPSLSQQLASLYQDMEAAYDTTATALGLECAKCDDNCCDSLFHHHTYSEWAYLWQGLQQLDGELLERLQQAARDYVDSLPAQATAPLRHLPCPLLLGGRCQLYRYRLMICRLHGVPAQMRLPDGRLLQFPGCFRSQDLCAGQQAPPQLRLDRTVFLGRLARVEKDLLAGLPLRPPRPRHTIAHMILLGPPLLP